MSLHDLHTKLSVRVHSFIAIGPSRPSLLEGLVLTLPTQAIEGRFGRLLGAAVGLGSVPWLLCEGELREVRYRFGALAVVRGGTPISQV